MKFFILFIITVACSTLFSQKKIFCGYEVLHNKTSIVSIENVEIKYNVNEYFLKTHNPIDSIVEKYKVVLNDKIRLIHRFPTLTTKLETMNTELDSLNLFNSSFCIQKLLNDSITINPEVRKVYLFHENKEKFILIEGAYADSHDKSNIHWVLLFNISDTNKVKFIHRDFTNNVFAFSNDYLGDFNSDGVIDFCFLNNNKIRVYNIKGDKLIELSDYYLSFSQNKNIYYLDLNKSNWFYNINKNCKKKKEKSGLKKEKTYIFPYSRSW